MIYSWGSTPVWRVKKHFLPPLVRSLRPLKPIATELEQIETFYSNTKAKIGKRWVFATIGKELEEPEVKLESLKVAAKNIKVVKGDYVKAMRKKP